MNKIRESRIVIAIDYGKDDHSAITIGRRTLDGKIELLQISNYDIPIEIYINKKCIKD